MKILLTALIAAQFTLTNACFGKRVVPAPQPLPTAARAPREVVDPKSMMEAEIAAEEAARKVEDDGCSACSDRSEMKAVPTAVTSAGAVATTDVTAKAAALIPSQLPIRYAGYARGADFIIVQCYTPDGFLHILQKKDGATRLTSVDQSRDIKIPTTTDPRVLQYLQDQLAEAESR